MTATLMFDHADTPRSSTIGLQLRPPSLSAPRPWSLTALRAPLAIKIVGANVLASLVLVALLASSSSPVGVNATTSIVTALLAAVLVHFALAAIALRPLRDMDAVVTRVRHGDFGARAIPSSIADGNVTRIASMLNSLLDELSADRERVRAFAAEVVEKGDRERSALARELHDSTAQRLAALLYQLSAVARDVEDQELSDRLLGIRELAGDVLEEVQTIARTVHPRVLDDLGLAPALRYLAREASQSSGLCIAVEVTGLESPIPAPQAAVLYSVAQLAVRNTVKYAAASHITLTLAVSPCEATVEIRDDGCGFDLVEAQRRRPEMGLFVMRERASLLKGRVELTSNLGSGTRVIAVMPLSSAPLTLA